MSSDPLRPDDAPSSIYGVDGEPQFFQDPAMDRFVGVVLNMASELWVQTERVDTLMRLIEAKGVATRGDLAEIAQSEDRARETALRDFVARLFAPLREPAG